MTTFVRLLLLAGLCSRLAPGLLMARTCPEGSAGTTVVYLNGIRTDPTAAQEDAAVLEARLRALLDSSAKASECVSSKVATNNTAGAVEDLWQSFKQRLGQNPAQFFDFLAAIDSAPDWFQTQFRNLSAALDEAVAAPELMANVKLYETQMRTNTVIVVAHSQGNLYANAEYRELRRRGHPLPDRKLFRIVAVATPATVVEGDGPQHTTVLGDFIYLVPGALGPTTTNRPEHSDGHSLQKYYLIPGSRSNSKIVVNIYGSVAGFVGECYGTTSPS